MILLDTSVLLDYFRKVVKEKTLFQNLAKNYSTLCISQITYFEILRGSNQNQKSFWIDIFEDLDFLDFDIQCADSAVLIYKELKSKNQLIESADLLIAATAIANNLPLATFNVKDFQKINSLDLVTF